MAKKEVYVKGTIRVSIEPDGISAFVSLTKDPQAQDLSGEQVIAKLREQKISYGMSEDEVRRQLKIAGEKTDQLVTFLAAKGDAPEATRPETVDWKLKEFPEHLIEPVKHKLASAKAPELYNEIQTKIKRQKEVEKKSSLPFMAPKKELVEVIETEVRKERVFVDPTVEITGWIGEGETLGLFYNKQQGKPGKNLFGNQIPAPESLDPNFYLGNGIEKKGNELKAQVSGIVRAGSNWAEIIPFAPHQWEVALSPDKVTCCLNLIPGDLSVPPPTYTEIMVKAQSLGFPVDQLISQVEMEHVIREHIQKQEEVKNLALTGHDDAFFDVVITDDGMQALLNMRKGRGAGKPLVLKEVGKAIRDSKIRIADNDVLRQDILNFYNSTELEIVGMIIAEGKAPKQGQDQAVDWSVRFFDEKEFLETKKIILENKDALSYLESHGTFPLEDISDLAMVEKDARILTLGPPQRGEPGMDVLGNSVEGLQGKPINLEIHEGLERRDNVVIATQPGIFERVFKDEIYFLRVRSHQDSDIRVTCSTDGLTALISFEQATGSGQKITMERIHKVLEEEGIKQGIDLDALDQIRQLLDDEKDCKDLVIARGTPAEEGGAYKLDLQIQVASGSKVQIRSDGTADYKNRDTMTRVDKDTLIARVSPPINEPKSGIDVRAKEILPKASKNEELVIGPNIRVEQAENGVRILYAAIDGELVYGKNSIDIKGVYTLKGNVSLSTGNIKFPGTIQIAGDVESGFVVMSDADVKIAGGVDAALVSAGGDILIKAGVKGNQKGVLRAKGNILASFIEQATVLAVGNLKVLKNILRSHIRCNGTITIPEKGAIIGGITKVKNGMDVGTLGSERIVPTRIHFGQDYLVEDQIVVEEKEIKKIQQQLTHIDLSMKKPEVVAQKTELQALFNQKTKYLKLLEKRNMRLFMLKERFEQHYDSQLRIRGSVHPGVLLESHGRTLEISTEKKNVIFTFDVGTGRILEKAIEDKK